MKVIFMGTPDFAVPTLKLLAQNHEVIAVYTQAPKPAGRGQSETLSPIHQLAIELNIPVYTPKTLRKSEPQEEFASLKADAAVVIAYGLILPREVLSAPKYGCINIHPSLLPKFRGAAPMQRTILAGEKETAMCIMKMDEGIDTGDILMMKKIPLDNDITYAQLSDSMAHLGAQMLIQTIAQIDSITSQKQSEDGTCYAPKISKEEAELDWNISAELLCRKVRALNPWPGTFFYSNGEKIKVLSAKAENSAHDYSPGTIVDEKHLIIACNEGLFQPLIVQRPGKKPMATADLLRGYQIKL